MRRMLFVSFQLFGLASRAKVRWVTSVHLLTGVMMALSAMVCSAECLATAETSDILSSAITVQDDLQRTVLLSKPAERIVVLGPSVVENVFAIGAGERIVGALAYSDYPAAAKSIPRVGSHNTVNYELILSLEPDLVLLWHSGVGDDVLNRLLDLGLTVYASEPKRLDDIDDTLRQLGRLTGMAEAAESASRRFNSRLEELRARYASQFPLSVFVEIWHEPLQTLSGRHVVNDVIAACGGRNVFADLPQLAPRVSTEAVIEANPSVMLMASSDGDADQWRARWRRWSMIDAVQRQQLYPVLSETLVRHTPRILLGVERVCRLLSNARREVWAEKDSMAGESNGRRGGIDHD